MVIHSTSDDWRSAARSRYFVPVSGESGCVQSATEGGGRRSNRFLGAGRDDGRLSWASWLGPLATAGQRRKDGFSSGSNSVGPSFLFLRSALERDAVSQPVQPKTLQLLSRCRPDKWYSDQTIGEIRGRGRREEGGGRGRRGMKSRPTLGKQQTAS